MFNKTLSFVVAAIMTFCINTHDMSCTQKQQPAQKQQKKIIQQTRKGKRVTKAAKKQEAAAKKFENDQIKAASKRLQKLVVLNKFLDKPQMFDDTDQLLAKLYIVMHNYGDGKVALASIVEKFNKAYNDTKAFLDKNTNALNNLENKIQNEKLLKTGRRWDMETKMKSRIVAAKFIKNDIVSDEGSETDIVSQFNKIADTLIKDINTLKSSIIDSSIKTNNNTKGNVKIYFDQMKQDIFTAKRKFETEAIERKRELLSKLAEYVPGDEAEKIITKLKCAELIEGVSQNNSSCQTDDCEFEETSTQTGDDDNNIDSYQYNEINRDSEYDYDSESEYVDYYESTAPHLITKKKK